jgi:hypothetical protein
MTHPVEVQRRANLKDRVLARLQQGPVKNTELVQIGISYKARIFELREEWDIRTESPQVGGVCVYRLIGKIEPPTTDGRLF